MSEALAAADDRRGESSGQATGRVTVLIAVAIGVAAIVTVFAVFGSLVAPQSSSGQDLLAGVDGPSRSHWLGTDELGRDVLSRIIVGTRTAVVGPIAIALGAMLLGNALGLIAGYFGGWFDSLIMRWADLMYALPGLLVAIVVLGVLGHGYWLAVLLLILLTMPYDTRIVRGAVLEQRGLPYVEAARTLGRPTWRILLQQIWPNIAPLVVATTFLNFALSLVVLSSLSFLGLGVAPGTADWGRMLAENRTLIFDNPASALAPGVMIVLAAASTNLIGDWFYERLTAKGRGR